MTNYDNYIDLARELERMKNVPVTVVPIVIGCTGLVCTKQNDALAPLKALGVEVHINWLQKIAAVETVNICTSFLKIKN